MNQIKDFFKKNSDLPPILFLSILILIIGIFVIGFIKTFILLLIIAILFIGYEYGDDIMKRIKTGKGNKVKITSSEEKPKKEKRIKAEKVKKTKKKRLLNTVMLTILSFIFIGLVAVAGFIGFIVLNAPDFDPDQLYSREKSVVYDSNNNKIAELGKQNMMNCHKF